MKFKKLFLIICIVICLFTMASACAGEVDDTAMTAVDLQDNLEINEDNQVGDKMTNPISAVDSTNNVSTEDDNIEISAPETTGNPDSNKLGSTDDNLVGANLKADVVAFNVSAADNTIFVVNCSDDFNGNVLIKIGDNILYDGGVKTIINGAKLPAGNHVATAVFYGDDDYGNLTLNDIRFTVSRVTPTIDVNINDTYYSKTAFAIVHIENNANGTVNVTVNGKTFNGTVYNGDAIVAISGLAAGYKEAKVEFFCRDDYNNNVNAFTKFIIYPNNSNIEIVNCPSTFKVDEDIEFEIKTQNSTGDVTIYINGAYQDTFHPDYGNYQIDLGSKPEGTYVIELRLDKDENYTGFATIVTVYVVKKDLSVNVIDIDEVISVGSPITITAKLNETVSGDVIFTINGANYTEHVDNHDVVTHAYTPVNNETLTVVATFTGNDMYNAYVSTSRDFNVNRNPIGVDVDFYSPIIAGGDAQIYVTMNPEINGTVILYVNDKSYNVAILNGYGVYTVSNLANAIYNVRAEFEGDDKYANSTSDVKQLFVNKVITNLNIGINKDSMSYHDFAVVSVVLDQSINAIATLKVNGTNHTVGLVNGKGSFTLNGLNKGNYTINAVFAGDDKYVQSTSNKVNLEITGDNISSSVSISLNSNSVFVGDKVIITVKSNPTVTGIIRLIIGSDSYNVAVNKGVGTFTISDLASGTYDVQAIFDGDNYHLGNSSEVKRLKVNRIPTTLSISLDNPSIFVGDSVVVSVVIDKSINNVATVNVNGKDYLIGIVKGKGNLTLSGLAFGTYNINATFAGEGKYESASDNVTLVVNKIETQLAGDPVTTIYNGDKYLVVTLKDSKANAIANVDVTFNLNGAKTLKTDGKGQIKVSTNGLAPNAYTAKIVFKGNAVYDGSSKDIKVTVKKANSKIVASAKTFKVKQVKKYTVTLKSGNKAISKMKVTLKIGKKTYVATTNAKGQATFNLKLAKGTFKPVVQFAANKYYNGATAKTTITVK